MRREGFTLIELMIVVAIIAIIAAIAIPSLLTAKKSGHEAATIASLRTLSSTQEQYASRFGVYGELADLGTLEYIDPVLAAADGANGKSGYQYSMTAGADDWSCTAVPLTASSGDRGFYVDQTGVIRFTQDGSEPDDADPAIDR